MKEFYIKNKDKINYLVVGIILGVFIVTFTCFDHNATSQFKPLRLSSLNDNPYKYIDPLLAINSPDYSENSPFNDIYEQILEILKNAKESNQIDEASVIFRDLENSSGFTINPDLKYNPASLLKVPTMIVFFKLAEENPMILKDKVFYSGKIDHNLIENIKPTKELVKGQYYTVEELITRMIKYSDNNSATLLVEYINNSDKEEYFNNLFNDLGVHNINLADDFITIKEYSRFFRILYNATYLSRDYSEKALEILTDVDFKGGIREGVPTSTTIAQKFGEFSLVTDKGAVIKRELHHCGIVYYSDLPYLLCVMTKGKDFEKMNAFIGEVSKKVYLDTLYLERS